MPFHTEEEKFNNTLTNGSKETKSKISSSDSKVDSMSANSAQRESEVQVVDLDDHERLLSGTQLIQLKTMETRNNERATDITEQEESKEPISDRNQKTELRFVIEDFEVVNRQKTDLIDEIDALSADFMTQTRDLECTSQSFGIFNGDLAKSMTLSPNKKA